MFMKLLRYIAAIALLCLVTTIAPQAMAQTTYTNTYTVSLAWDASPSPSITNYAVYWGVTSGNYTNHVDAGTNLTVSVSGLKPVTTYYFAATAKDVWGLESDFSAEVYYTTPRPKPLPPGQFRKTAP